MKRANCVEVFFLYDIFSDLQMLLRSLNCICSSIKLHGLWYLSHCNAYLVSKHTANIMKCLDWEIETFAIALILRRVECSGAAPVLTILIMLWQWVSDKSNQDIERSLRHLSRLIIMVWVELIMTKMGGAHCGKNGWNWCYRHRDKNGWSSMWQKWVELSMKIMGRTHCGKNGWSSLWQKWMELVL